jgi:hypothetical protein
MNSNALKSNKENEKGKARVFIWPGNSNNIGHAAIQFEDNESKQISYLSIWPKNLPAKGLVAIFPLKAALQNSFYEDMKAESIGSRRIENGDFADGAIKVAIHEEQVNPPQEYLIDNLNISKMQMEQKRLEEGIQLGSIRYQLFPNVRITSFLKKTLSFSAHNLFSDELECYHNQMPLPEQYNCSTLVQRLIEIGGQSIAEEPIYIPASLADKLDKLSRVNHNIKGP